MEIQDDEKKNEQKIREWLDWHAADIKDRDAHAKYSKGIRTCYPPDYILIYEGIEKIADMLGAKLETKKFKGTRCGEWTQYSFMYESMYGDIEVIQVGGIEDAEQICM